MTTQNNVYISNGCIADFNDLIQPFLDEMNDKLDNGVDVKTITEDYTTFSKSIVFTTDFSLEQLLSLDNTRKLADTLIYNGKNVNLS